MDLLHHIETFAVQLGDSPWLLAVVLVLAVIDGVFPPVPSETVLITAAVLSAAGTGPHLLLLVLAAAGGALLGDLLAFTLGRRVPVRKIPGLRGPRGQRMLTRAGAALDRRGATLVIVGRFVPVGRVGVNVSAGTLGYSPTKFTLAAAAAALLWSAYNATIAVGAHWLLGSSPLLAIAVGMLSALLLGLALEAAIRRAERRRAERDAEPADAGEDDEDGRRCAERPAAQVPEGRPSR